MSKMHNNVLKWTQNKVNALQNTKIYLNTLKSNKMHNNVLKITKNRVKYTTNLLKCTIMY